MPTPTRAARVSTRSLKSGRKLVLRWEFLKWTLVGISIVNISIGVPTALGIISPCSYLLSAPHSFCENSEVERLLSVCVGISLVQVGLLRWLFVRNFGQSFGLRWLTAASFLLEVARDVLFANKEGAAAHFGDDQALKITIPSLVLAVGLAAIRPEKGGYKDKIS